MNPESTKSDIDAVWWFLVALWSFIVVCLLVGVAGYMSVRLDQAGNLVIDDGCRGGTCGPPEKPVPEQIRLLPPVDLPHALVNEIFFFSMCTGGVK